MKCALIMLIMVVAVAWAEAKSDCEKHREEAEKIGTIMKLIPKCKENGDYEALQCYKDSDFCVCYDPKGHAASPISTKIKECGCFLRRKEKLESEANFVYIPQCEETGAWTPKQCWDFNNSCWCVNEEGHEVGKIYPEEHDFKCD